MIQFKLLKIFINYRIDNLINFYPTLKKYLLTAENISKTQKLIL